MIYKGFRGRVPNCTLIMELGAEIEPPTKEGKKGRSSILFIVASTFFNFVYQKVIIIL